MRSETANKIIKGIGITLIVLGFLGGIVSPTLLISTLFITDENITGGKDNLSDVNWGYILKEILIGVGMILIGFFIIYRVKYES